MARLIDYDVTGVEESSGGTGVKVRPGVYPAKIMKCEHRTQNRAGGPANDLEVALNVGEEYDWVFTYIGLSDAADWKLAEFIRALNLKEKGKLDPAKLVGKVIRVKINPGEYNGDYSPDAGRLMKAQDGDEDAIGSSVTEADDGPDVGPSDNGDGPAASYDDPDFEPSRESDPEVGSYDNWEDGDLEAEVSDRGLTVPGGRGSKRQKYIDALRAEDESFDGSGGDAADDAASAADDDYDEWDLDKLKAEWDERNLGDQPNFRGRGAADRIVAALIEGLRADDVENPFNP